MALGEGGGALGGGGIGGRQNPIKLIASLFFVIKIVKYFGIVGGGIGGGAPKSYKMIMAPPLSLSLR